MEYVGINNLRANYFRNLKLYKLEQSESIVKYLRNNYPFITIKHIKKLNHIDINTNVYIVFSKKENFVLRNFSRNINPEKIERICNILDFCIKNKVNVSEPIKNKNNSYVDKRNRRYLTKYYEGSSYRGTVYELKDMAKNLAILHKTLARNTISFNYRNDTNYEILTPTELQKIKEAIKKKNVKEDIDYRVYQNLNDLIAYSKEDNKMLQKMDLDKFDKQLIHFDLHPGNVIFKNNQVIAIIDFNSMRKDEKIKDLSFASLRFASYGACEVEKIRNRIKIFVNAYRNYDDIDEHQLSNFNYFITHEILGRLSFIIRKLYHYNSNTWVHDFDKFMILLKLATKLKSQQIKFYKYKELKK